MNLVFKTPAGLALFDPAIEWRECQECLSWKNSFKAIGLRPRIY
jgi:hypothetical protein